MSFNPILYPPVAILSCVLILSRPTDKSVSLYSSLSLVTAVYSLGTKSHTTMASSVAMSVARIYGCRLKT